MKSLLRKLSVAMLMLSLLVVTPLQVSAATKSVTGTTSEKLSKIPSVKVGTTKVNVKSFPKGYSSLTNSRVKFTAPKAGTYDFIFSGFSSSKLDCGGAVFTIQEAIDYGSFISFNKLKLEGTLVNDFILFEAKEYAKALLEMVTEASVDFDDPQEYINQELQDLDKQLQMSDKYSELTVTFKLKKGQTVYISAKNACELNTALGLEYSNKPFNYTLKIKKTK